MWIQPHAFLHAAAFASGKKCLDGKACMTPLRIAQEQGKTVIEVEVKGRSYKATMGPDKRPERIETTLTMPSGVAKRIVAIFADYRTGEKPDAGFGLAEGKDALDRFHTGTYWPSRLVHEVDGTKGARAHVDGRLGQSLSRLPRTRTAGQGPMTRWRAKIGTMDFYHQEERNA